MFFGIGAETVEIDFIFCIIIIIILICFLGLHLLSLLHFFLLQLHPWHMEVPRLGVESEWQVPAYTTATATQDPSCVFDPHHSSRLDP